VIEYTPLAEAAWIVLATVIGQVVAGQAVVGQPAAELAAAELAEEARVAEFVSGAVALVAAVRACIAVKSALLVAQK